MQKQPQGLQAFIQINTFREKKHEKLKIRLIVSHLAERRTLTLKKIG